MGKTYAVGKGNAMVEDMKGRVVDTLKFIVVSHLQKEIILGIDAIKAFGLTLDIINDSIIHLNGLFTNYKRFLDHCFELLTKEQDIDSFFHIKDKYIRETLKDYSDGIRDDQEALIGEHTIELVDDKAGIHAMPYLRLQEDTQIIFNYVNEKKEN